MRDLTQEEIQLLIQRCDELEILEALICGERLQVTVEYIDRIEKLKRERKRK